MKLTQVKGNTWVLEGLEFIPLYRLDGGRCILMDTGLAQEREELEGNYYGLRGLAYDGTPHSSSPGKPTEEAGLRALESGAGDRLAEIKANETVLSADAAAIRGCLDAVNGKYKQVILMRYVRGYSWAKTGVRMNAPDSTVRNWHERAMERFGEALEELPEAAELAARAARART